MNIQRMIAGAVLAGGVLFPSQAKAEDHSVPHSHVHHVAVGPEVDSHKTVAHFLYTRELLDHWSAGAAISLGSDYHGTFAGGLEAVGSFHMGVAKPFFVVGEVGLGVEFAGSHLEPVAKLTGLVGLKITDALGASVGPSVAVTRHDVQPALAANLAIGF